MNANGNARISDDTVVIVYQKRKAKYAHLMSQLITAHTGHEVAEWEEKIWEANKHDFLSSQKVIFFGRTGDNHKTGIKWKFDEFALQYGWLGNRCVVFVGWLNVFQVPKFYKHYKARAEYFEASVKDAYKKTRNATATGATVAAGAVGVVAAAKAMVFLAPLALVGGGIWGANEVAKAMHTLIVYEFVLGADGGFKQFMEN